MNLEHYSPEILISEVLPKFPVSKLRTLCQSNVYYRDLCQDDDLWYYKAKYDYPLALDKPDNLNWYNYYQDLYRYYDKFTKRYGRKTDKNVSYGERYQYFDENTIVCPVYSLGISIRDYVDDLSNLPLQQDYHNYFSSSRYLGSIDIVPTLTTHVI